MEQRQQREIEPTLHFLNELIATPEFAQENEQVQKRIRDTREFMDIATGWTREMIRLPAGTLARGGVKAGGEGAGGFWAGGARSRLARYEKGRLKNQ